jgi:chemotaxis protein methyltransferase CheR
MAIAESETRDYTEFKARVLELSGIDLGLYKHRQMHRRLCGMVDRARARGFMEYFALLQRDAEEYETFIDRLTINVSEMFRNPEKWKELRERVLPLLLERKPSLKVWSAGCSHGAEAYSLAILLDLAGSSPAGPVHATDLDAGVLGRAKEGVYSAQDVRNVEPTCLARYFQRVAGAAGHMGDSASAYQVRRALRSRVRFARHNLLADPFESGYDLICCRNVVIYFTDEAKERLFERLAAALAPGGVLFLGGTERIFSYREIGLEVLAPFFYRRPR